MPMELPLPAIGNLLAPGWVAALSKAAVRTTADVIESSVIVTWG